MKSIQTGIILSCFVFAGSLAAQSLRDYKPKKGELTKEQISSKLEDRKLQAVKLSKVQDELSADVQELIEEQTNEKVIGLLEEVEELMANVTDNLQEADTGLDTIHNENVIIEKIFEAAKEKSK